MRFRRLTISNSPKMTSRRMDELAEKARAGELTGDVEIEIDNYRQVGCLIEFMKSKARLFLRNSSA